MNEWVNEYNRFGTYSGWSGDEDDFDDAHWSIKLAFKEIKGGVLTSDEKNKIIVSNFLAYNDIDYIGEDEVENLIKKLK